MVEMSGRRNTGVSEDVLACPGDVVGCVASKPPAERERERERERD